MKKKAPNSYHEKVITFYKEGTKNRKTKKTVDNPDNKGWLKLSFDIGSDFFSFSTRKKPDVCFGARTGRSSSWSNSPFSRTPTLMTLGSGRMDGRKVG